MVKILTTDKNTKMLKRQNLSIRIFNIHNVKTNHHLNKMYSVKETYIQNVPPLKIYN
jgi:hypothetical protein